MNIIGLGANGRFFWPGSIGKRGVGGGVALSAAVRLSSPSISPGSGPVGTVFTITASTFSGVPTPIITGSLTQAAVDVTGAITPIGGGQYTFTSTATGALVWSDYATNSGGVTATVTASATIVAAGATEFGALTRTGAGAVALPVGATSITNAGGTGLVVVAGNIQPSANAVVSGTLTFDNAATMVISAIPNAYSVANIDQMKVVGELTTLALGDNVLMRAGAYNSAYADKRITRTVVPTGTWNGANYVVFKPHTGAVVDLHRIDVYGTTVQNTYFEFTGMRMVAGAASAVIGCVRLWTSASYIYVHDTTSNTPDPGPTLATNLSSYFYSSANTGAGNLRIENNIWNNSYKAVVASGNDLVVKGNSCKNAYGDFLQLTPPIARLQVIGNTFTDKQSAFTPYTITAITRGATTLVTLTSTTGIAVNDDVYFTGLTGCTELQGGKYNISAVNTTTNVITVSVNSTAYSAYVSGGLAKVTGIHGDFLQVVGASATDGQLDNVVIRGNRFTRGAGTTGDTEAQGIFLADNIAGVYYRNALIEGNIIDCTFVNGISIQNPLNSMVRNNTIVGKLGQFGTATRISFAGTGTGNSCLDNVSNAFNFTATVETQTNNYTIANDATAYAAAFDAPPTGEQSSVASVSYAPKALGPLATASPVIGALPHQSFVSPWTFTNPRFTVPAAFTAGMWTLTDPATDGDLTVTVASLPSNGGTAITDIQYRVDGGSWVTLGGALTGAYNIAGLTNASHTVELRSVNALGSAAASDVKSATPTVPAYAQKRYATNKTFYSSGTPAGSVSCVEMSIWLKPLTLNSAERLIRASLGIEVYFAAGGVMTVLIYDSAGTQVYNGVSATGVISSAAYQHIYIGAKLSATSSREIRVNGTVITMATETVNLLTGAVAGTGMSRPARAHNLFSSTTTTGLISAEFGDLWLAYQNSLVGYASFHSSGSPVSLVGVGTPAIWLGNTQTAANINAGGDLGATTLTVGSATMTDVP